MSKHYYKGTEVMEIIEKFKLDFALGNVVKYVLRAGVKAPDTEMEDLKKALWYLKRYLKMEHNFFIEQVKTYDGQIKIINEEIVESYISIVNVNDFMGQNETGIMYQKLRGLLLGFLNHQVIFKLSPQTTDKAKWNNLDKAIEELKMGRDRIKQKRLYQFGLDLAKNQPQTTKEQMASDKEKIFNENWPKFGYEDATEQRASDYDNEGVFDEANRLAKEMSEEVYGSSVLKPWVMKLGLRHQGTLLTAIRGCDLTPKYPLDSTERNLTAFIRYAVMIPFDKREVDSAPGCFMQSTFDTGEFKPSALGHYPHHYIMHTLHALEIIAYHCPYANHANEANRAYIKLVESMHLNPETAIQLEERMNEDRIAKDKIVGD